MFSRLFVTLALLSLGLHAFAQEEAAAEEEAGPWAGKVSLGYLATSGNTENSSLNSSFEVSYTTGKCVHIANGFAINASESNATTSEAFGAGWKRQTDLSRFWT